MLKIGVGKAGILYPQDFFSSGQEGFSGVHDTPLVHVTVLESDRRIVFAVCDIVDIDDWHDIRQKIANTVNCSVENVILHVNQVFSTPSCSCPKETSERQEDAKSTLLHRVVLSALLMAALEAQANLVPVKIGIGYGVCRVGVNCVLKRNREFFRATNESGETEHLLPVIRFENDAGELISVLFTVSSAAGVLENAFSYEGNRLISGDMASGSERLLEEQLCANAVYLLGASADQWPTLRAEWDYIDGEKKIEQSDIQKRGFLFIELLSRRLARSVVQTMDFISCEEVRGAVRLHRRKIIFPACGQQQVSEAEIIALKINELVLIGCPVRFCKDI